MTAATTKRPRKACRWVARPFGNGRVWEYRERKAGVCKLCRLPVQWFWAGSREEWILALAIVDTHKVPLAVALGVRGFSRDGTCLCSTCRNACGWGPVDVARSTGVDSCFFDVLATRIIEKDPQA